jgi:hypothetical protein
MKRTTYMIIGAAAVLLLSAVYMGFNMDRFAVDSMLRTGASNKHIENRQLPKFTYLVIEDSLSVWYRQYLKYDKDNVENGETKNVVNIQYNGNGAANTISLPREFMNRSRFYLHGDTLHVKIGCAGDLGRDMFEDVTGRNLSKVYVRFIFKEGGRTYTFIGGRIKFEQPKIMLSVANNIKRIDNRSSLSTNMKGFRQDSLLLASNTICKFYGCSFDKLNFAAGKSRPTVTLHSTQVKQLYMNIYNNSCNATDGNTINEFFINVARNAELSGLASSSFSYKKPFTAHFTPIK